MAFRAANSLLLHLCCLVATSVAGRATSTAVRTSVNWRRKGAQWTVNLLVARHGVSCTNTIEKWSSLGGADFTRGFMLDPPLAGMADEGNKEAQAALNRWSEKSGLKIDAVLSSVLLRAMETAVAMFDAKQLYVVPFLREHAGGDSNSPSSQDAQSEALKEMKHNQKVNFSFVNSNDGYKKGTWEDFVGFLQEEFLPFVVGKLDAAEVEQKNITLLLATHSKFLKEKSAALSERCQGLWNTADGKPFNSQVFMVKYTFSAKCEGCPYSLVPQDDSCEEVYHGTSIYNDEGKLKPLCVSDMGDRCIDKISRYSLSPKPLIKKTMDWQVAQQSHEVHKSNEQIEKLRQTLGCNAKESNEACQERFSGDTKLVKKLQEALNKDIDVVNKLFFLLNTKLVKKLQEALNKDIDVVNKLFFLLNTNCVGGGLPQVVQLARYKDLDLPPGVLQHTGPDREEE